MPQPDGLEVKSSELHVEQPLALQKTKIMVRCLFNLTKRLSQRPIRREKETEQQRMKSLHSTRQHREEQQEICEKLSEQKPILMEQYNFFITLRSYIVDLLDCLDEKNSKKIGKRTSGCFVDPPRRYVKRRRRT
ncbi:conserved hypothetical protein [Trichinella spiralis]|uniref:hypothetical protein n=1 Tax=Trichinella spiralis TaxID=6334 RepID=UPI0001EFEDE5|nr:conserved hypothetical protein [Trichinella spiralis]